MAFEPVYIIDGARSPFLKARNAPGPFSAFSEPTAHGASTWRTPTERSAQRLAR